MSFFELNTATSLNSNFDETQWIKHIRQTLDDELEEDTDIPVTIFSVPKALMIIHPDSYIPHQVAIGPYHRLRPELYEMERYKVTATKRNQKDLLNVKIQDLVDHLMKLDLRIRACYHKPLSFGCEALAWMMAVDVSFLFEFLQVCAVKEGKILTKIPSSRLAHLVDLSGKKTAHNTILRDIIMLENQIPLFVMRMLLEFQFPSLDMADEMLLAMLVGLSKHLSPFKMVERSQKIAVDECAHLLDFLYNFVVPKTDQLLSAAFEIDVEEGEDLKDEKDDSSAKQLHGIVWNTFSKFKEGAVQRIKSIILSKPPQAIVKLPGTFLSKNPVLSATKPVGNMFSTFNIDKEKKDEEESSSSSTNIQRPPLQKEIDCPSVTQLLAAGVQFLPTDEGIESIKFDEKTLTLYIPVIKLDVNSEVVLRNLVAYEACSASGPLVLTRYAELMNGIIDTDLDAKFLCQRGIIINHLNSEKEVTDLWNGMSKSIRLTKVPSLDKVIADVNKFYKGRWKVKFGNIMKEYVFGSWRILSFLGAMFVLLLMSLQAFCQVYNCSRNFPIKIPQQVNN